LDKRGTRGFWKLDEARKTKDRPDLRKPAKSVASSEWASRKKPKETLPLRRKEKITCREKGRRGGEGKGLKAPMRDKTRGKKNPNNMEEAQTRRRRRRARDFQRSMKEISSTPRGRRGSKDRISQRV